MTSHYCGYLVVVVYEVGLLEGGMALQQTLLILTQFIEGSLKSIDTNTKLQGSLVILLNFISKVFNSLGIS